MSPDDCCGNCQFFKRTRMGEAGGFCRSRPPMPLPVGVTQDAGGRQVPAIYTYWPQVPDTELCGDHRPVTRAREAVKSIANMVAEGAA